MGLIAGCDEAGRGCVVGSLYVAGLATEESNVDSLKSLGVKDSKLLSRKKRESIFPELVKNYQYSIKTIMPSEIDKYVGRKGMNLNWLESRSFAEIIDELAPQKVIVDCPDINIPRFEKTLKSLMYLDCEIEARYHADRDFVFVGAASILAKVTRDRALDVLKEKYGDMGSGYPSDPKCQAFFIKWLSEHGGERPSWTRRSWSSWERWASDEQTLLFPASVFAP